MTDFGIAKYDQAAVHARGSVMASYGDDSSVFAEFYDKPFYMEAESRNEGRPIYKERTFCRITFPGDRTKVWDQPVRMEDDGTGISDIRRFPRQWEAYQNKRVQVPDGVPLAEFAAISKSRVLELKAMNIHTVEQYAATSDNANLGLGWQKERDACRNYLDSAKGIAESVKLKHTLEMQAQEIEMLKEQIRELGSMGYSQEQPARRGRPPKTME